MNGNVQPSDQELKEAKDKLERAKEQLQKAESCWENDAFIEALKKMTQEEKENANRLKSDIGTKLLMIENAQIASVVNRVKENSQQLESSITDLGGALRTLSNVTRILNATGSLLSIIGRILAL